jgi:glutathione S-transferase
LAKLTEFILHNYGYSNFAEKARLAFGYKGLSWRSVDVPETAPKPKLTPLTGGYRRTPVLQIGADIYCDTRLILREVERRQPSPTLYPTAYTANAKAIAFWAENQLFRPMSLYVSGNNLDVLPADLQADRSRMRGLPIPDADTVKRAAQRSAPAVRIQIAWIEDMLADGRLWIIGPEITVADFAVYHALWFITARSTRLAYELEPYPRLKAWMTRVSAFGHGVSAPMTSEEALATAAAAEPEAPRGSSPFDEDPPLGARVRILADDYGRDSVEGDLVMADLEQIALRRNDAEVGDVVVHFPRLGFDLRPV